jgi:predicted choloylglycine hydrolase
MTNPFNLNVLTLEGTPREVGRAHGEGLRATIQEFFQKQTTGLEAYLKMTYSAYLDMLFADTQFLQAAEKWTPDLVEEVHGIAEGANLDFRAMFAYQLLDEADWYLSQKTMGLFEVESNHCSALGAYGKMGQPNLIAQNADMGKSVDGYGTLLHVKYTRTGMEKFVATIPGVIGVWGLNNRSIGICLNAMTVQMKKSSRGLGTIFISQGILAKETFTEADHFIREIPHASGENYTIGSPEMVADYECSAHKVNRYIPFEGANVVYHTNHPIDNDDLDLTPENVKKLSPELQAWVVRAQQNTDVRFNSVEKRMKNLETTLTVEKVKEILSSHDTPDDPVCRHKRDDQNGMTNFSMIMELKEDPRLHIASGPPCMTEFRVFNFRDGLEKWTRE